ncbi:hypothetical protein MKI84_05615 [Ancylobacter sp. A5.8]|uniref:hypothetical protein n=1 Tax=Ancylobacter gelatini TaxID=2919920 RepID=UPI001F4DD7B9|nr:hypothetical protein [Ancylobacter gelatini]MCJ8142387.1 hypothetical protein [Ancylobacter gelatini]
MKRKIAALSCAAAMTVAGLPVGVASAQQRSAGQALQEAVDRTCVVEITTTTISTASGRIQLQNLCYNPRAVRISWSDGRLVDYCLNSAGDVRYVQKLTDSYKLTREQDILLCP